MEETNDNLTEVSSDGNGKSLEGRILVVEIRLPGSSGANSVRESESLDRVCCISIDYFVSKYYYKVEGHLLLLSY